MASRALLGLAVLAPVLAGCATTVDGDADGLPDDAEGAARSISVGMREGFQVRAVTSDPALKDTDGDGLTDGEEVEALTDARDPDTDADGLVDGRDLLLHPGDALYEPLRQRGAVQAADGRFLGEADAGTRPFEWDGDRPFPDGLGDGDEVRGWTVTTAAGSRAVRSDPAKPDTDGDGLADNLEREHGCDPTAPDTDGDGARDPVDAACAWNLQLRVAVTRITLNQSLDPTGETDLVLTAQAGGLKETHRQGLRAGDNAVAFTWLADVPDGGRPGQLQLAVALTFVDQDIVGDDDRSGVDHQPICVAALTGQCNVLVLEVDPFTGRFTSPQGWQGNTTGEARGRDGAVGFSVEAVRG